MVGFGRQRSPISVSPINDKLHMIFTANQANVFICRLLSQTLWVFYYSLFLLSLQVSEHPFSRELSNNDSLLNANSDPHWIAHGKFGKQQITHTHNSWLSGKLFSLTFSADPESLSHQHNPRGSVGLERGGGTHTTFPSQFKK